MYNPLFNYGEFATIKNQAGLNRFKISIKEFVERTGAIGLMAKAGRYGGTYAHKDIAFEFAMWISPEFKIYMIKEFQRLKAEEQKQLGWTAKRELSKINYRIHTDAIQHNLIPQEITPAQAGFIYAEEADADPSRGQQSASAKVINLPPSAILAIFAPAESGRPNRPLMKPGARPLHSGRRSLHN